MYLLDTSVVSAARRPDRSPRVAQWLLAQADAELFLSVVTLGEIERGVEMQVRRDPAFAAALRRWLAETEAVFADRIIPFGAAEARVWGRHSARLGHAGADLLIAATAEVRRLTVATLNPRDFEPTGVPVVVPGQEA